MPALTVSLNGNHLATISSKNLNIIHIRVHGDLIGTEFASLNAIGGLYGDDIEKNQHFIWINDQEILPDDEVVISFIENSETSHPGKTINEIYPESEYGVGPWQKLTENQLLSILAEKPKIRDVFNFCLIPPSNEVITASTRPEDHSFGFRVLWDLYSPQQAKVSLSSSSLQNIANGEPHANHARFLLEFNQIVRFRVCG